jgi:hypothetical protein
MLLEEFWSIEASNNYLSWHRLLHTTIVLSVQPKSLCCSPEASCGTGWSLGGLVDKLQFSAKVQPKTCKGLQVCQIMFWLCFCTM